MKEKMIRFMQGRYGVDRLSRAMMILAVLFTVLSLFTRQNGFYSLGLLLLILVYIRMFSKNIPKRYQENQKYLALEKKVTDFFHIGQSGPRDTTHRVFRCPNCKQKIRVPKGRGKIEIRCPKCSTQFIKRS